MLEDKINQILQLYHHHQKLTHCKIIHFLCENPSLHNQHHVLFSWHDRGMFWSNLVSYFQIVYKIYSFFVLHSIFRSHEPICMIPFELLLLLLAAEESNLRRLLTLVEEACAFSSRMFNELIAMSVWLMLLSLPSLMLSLPRPVMEFMLCCCSI